MDYLNFQLKSVQLYLSAATRITQIPANPSQLTSFSTTKALTERYFRTDHNIIYTKKNIKEEVGGSGTAKTSQTNPPITKSNDWDP